MVEEVWKTCIQNNNYAVSDMGRVKRISRGYGTQPGRILKPIDNRGYLRVHFGSNPGWHYIHALVLIAFTCLRPEGYECNHKNGIKSDNKLGNLEWVTKSQNLKHASKLGLISYKSGVDNHNAKLTADEIKEIRLLLSIGYYQYEIAPMFNVSQSNISYINTGTTYKDV